MSFKRDGDDNRLLSSLRKRRIQELFADDIPEREAKLCANGRFACLVCPAHPVFDTITMLSIHRNGKKHLSCLEFQKRKDDELRSLIAIRKHEQFLATGSDCIDVAETGTYGNRLTSAHPYDSRVKRRKGKLGDRKMVLNLDSSCSPSSSNSLDSNTTRTSDMNTISTNSDSKYHSSNPITTAASQCSLSDSDSYSNRTCEISNDTNKSKSWGNIIRQQQMDHGPITHSPQLKHLFTNNKINNSQQTPNQIHPYQSTKPTTTFSSLSNANPMHSPSQRNCTNTKGSNHNYSIQSCIEQQNNIPVVFSLLQRSFHCSETPNSSKSLSGPKTCEHGVSMLEDRSQNCKKEKAKPVHSTHLNVDPQQQKDDNLIQKYKQLQGSGWKRDWDGKWTKDDQAEFDSDEEPPDLP